MSVEQGPEGLKAYVAPMSVPLSALLASMHALPGYLQPTELVRVDSLPQPDRTSPSGKGWAVGMASSAHVGSGLASRRRPSKGSAAAEGEEKADDIMQQLADEVEQVTSVRLGPTAK